MATSNFQTAVTELLKQADVIVNGDRPWDIQIKDPAFYARVLRDGSLGIGEGYMDGQWEVDDLETMAVKVLKANLGEKVLKNPKLLWHGLNAKLFNQARKSKAFEVGQQHYDIGNDLYERMLDKRMVYTCGYWKEAKNLDEAQEAKLDLICQKVGLQKGMHVLDIGGGWGSFAKFAAEKYGAHVVNVTVSKEQVALANERCKGLPVENVLMDYRDATADKLLGKDKKFDRIISIGMFEHVGVKNYRTFMEMARNNLTEDGLVLLHTIGRNNSATSSDPWASKYIFANSMLPSIKQIGQSIEDLFIMEDWHNFSADYEKTLLAWWHNFDTHWPEIKDKYGDRFYRMWRLYILGSAASFQARNIQLWQVVLSPHGIPGGYQSIR